MSVRNRTLGRRSPVLAVLAAMVIGLICLAPLSVPAFSAPTATAAAPSAVPHLVGPAGFQATVITADGVTTGTPGQTVPRRGLSIVKLYIADHVLVHGLPEDHEAALEMLRSSDDQIATRLYADYPDSIGEVARRFDLTSTVPATRWGHALTSSADAARFLHTLAVASGRQPILEALATAYPIAADGYPQNFGTALLPGALGTKWGWDDDRLRSHASATFGTGYVAAAFGYGDAAALTEATLTTLGPLTTRLLQAPHYRL